MGTQRRLVCAGGSGEILGGRGAHDVDVPRQIHRHAGSRFPVAAAEVARTESACPAGSNFATIASVSALERASQRAADHWEIPRPGGAGHDGIARGIGSNKGTQIATSAAEERGEDRAWLPSGMSLVTKQFGRHAGNWREPNPSTTALPFPSTAIAAACRRPSRRTAVHQVQVPIELGHERSRTGDRRRRKIGRAGGARDVGESVGIRWPRLRCWLSSLTSEIGRCQDRRRRHPAWSGRQSRLPRWRRWRGPESCGSNTMAVDRAAESQRRPRGSAILATECRR